MILLSLQAEFEPDRTTMLLGFHMLTQLCTEQSMVARSWRPDNHDL